MPNILDPNSSTETDATKTNWTDINHDYEYPDPLGSKFKPGTKVHDRLVRKLLRRARDSRDKMQVKYKKWERIDKALKAYQSDETLDSNNRVDADTPITVPVLYSTLETLLTYLTKAFLQMPIFKYRAVGPEDRLGSILLEKLIENQCNHSKVGLAMHTLFRDSLVYGVGIVSPTWETKYGYKAVKSRTGFISRMTSAFEATGFEKATTRKLVYEGNALQNIDPYMYLPDPNVPIHKVQEGEWVGWVDRNNYYSLLELEGEDDSDFFNVKYLKNMDGKSTLIYDLDQASGTKYDANPATTSSPVDLVYLYVNLIPEDWGLGDGEYPEKWLFILAGDEVIISAKPLGLNHEMFPVCVAAPDFDGYSTTPNSRIEVVYPLQETMDWLFSSHMANVRKSLNDMLIVDPSMININDLQSPEPGKLIRTRRSAWGRGVENSVKQLNVTDITKGNIADSQFLSDLINRVSAASDSLQGMTYNKGEAKSAAESTAARAGAVSRLDKMAQVISMQCLQDIGYMFASHTQQLMSEETYIEVMGRWEEELKKTYGFDDQQARVSPLDILIDFDVVPYDGAMPGAEPTDLWVQLYQILAQNQEVAQQFDMVKIFKHIAYQMGAKGIDEFAKRMASAPNPQSMASDEQAVMEAAVGGATNEGGNTDGNISKLG
tara:strand:- start:3174 stop:5156 length:1983 start_codon:yes stop_codon:yes gene_type:complete